MNAYGLEQVFTSLLYLPLRMGPSRPTMFLLIEGYGHANDFLIGRTLAYYQFVFHVTNGLELRQVDSFQ